MYIGKKKCLGETDKFNLHAKKKKINIGRARGKDQQEEILRDPFLNLNILL